MMIKEIVLREKKLEIVLAYLERGYHAFVLKYSVGADAVFPEPLIDASLAVAYMKSHAEEFHINPERILQYKK